jgi:hypothetical protein
MSDFKVGDKVLINGGVIATITVYNELADRVVWEAPLRGGATDTGSGHISNTNIEHLANQTVESVIADAPGKSKRNAVTNDSGAGTAQPELELGGDEGE